MTSTGTVPIKIGSTLYNIDTSQIPYFHSFVRFELAKNPDLTEFTHGEIAQFPIAFLGITQGLRHCFHQLPLDLAEYSTLFDTLTFLCILEPPAHYSIPDTYLVLKQFKNPMMDETEIWRLRNKSRDAALELVHLIGNGMFEDEIAVAAKIFEAVKFIVSHSETFSWKTRTIVRMAYEERFAVTEKQTMMLDRWKKDGFEGEPDYTKVQGEEWVAWAWKRCKTR